LKGSFFSPASMRQWNSSKHPFCLNPPPPPPYHFPFTFPLRSCSVLSHCSLPLFIGFPQLQKGGGGGLIRVHMFRVHNALPFW
jgi:hypothetical protein